MVTAPLGNSVMEAMKEASRGMLASAAMVVRRDTTTLGVLSRSEVLRPPMFTAAETTMGGRGGRELEGVGEVVREGDAPTVTLGVGVCVGVRVTLALAVSERVGLAVRVCVREPVTVPVLEAEPVALAQWEAEALREAREAVAEAEGWEGEDCALGLACGVGVAAGEEVALTQALPLSVRWELPDRDTEALGEASRLGLGVALEEGVGRAAVGVAALEAVPRPAPALGEAAAEALLGCAEGVGVAAAGVGEERGVPLKAVEGLCTTEGALRVVTLGEGEGLLASEGEGALEKEAEAVELRESVGLTEGLALREAAAEALGQLALALSEGMLCVARALAHAEGEGCETVARGDCVPVSEEKEEGLVLGPCVTERDREALLEEEGEAWLGVLCAVAEAVWLAREGVPKAETEPVREAAALVLALGVTLWLPEAAALLLGEWEPREALARAEVEEEGEERQDVLAWGLCEAEPDREGGALALKEACALAERLALAEAVGEALCREAEERDEGEGEGVVSKERVAAAVAETQPLALCEGVVEPLRLGDGVDAGEKDCDRVADTDSLCALEALGQGEALREATSEALGTELPLARFEALVEVDKDGEALALGKVLPEVVARGECVSMGVKLPD